VVHTLRFVFDNDSLFFQALRAYLAQFSGGNAVTADFTQVAEQVLGRDLDSLMNEWVYGEGHPIYSALWNQVGSTVYVKLTQLTSHPSVSLFHNPIALRFYSGQGDTTVRIQQTTPAQVFSF